MSKSKSTATVEAQPVARRELWTRAQAAQYLGVSPGTLSRWAAERTGPPFIKLHDGEAGSVRYPSDLMAEFVANRIKAPKAK